MAVNYSEINDFLDSNFKVKFLSHVNYDSNIRSWGYSTNIGKSRYSNRFPVEFIESLSFTEMGMLFFIVYKLLPIGKYGYDGYLFEMSIENVVDGCGRGVSKDTFYRFKNKLVFYGVAFKVNGMKDENGKGKRNMYFFNPRYASRSRPVIAKGSEPPSHEYMSNYNKEKLKNKDIDNETFETDEQ